MTDPRNLQANERTLLAWVRTGLALMAFGLVIDRMALWFRYELHADEGFSLILGSAAIALGAGCQLVGAIRFVAMHQWPWYPGTGAAEERGVGNIFNVPRPPGLKATGPGG